MSDDQTDNEQLRLPSDNGDQSVTPERWQRIKELMLVAVESCRMIGRNLVGETRFSAVAIARRCETRAGKRGIR